MSPARLLCVGALTLDTIFKLERLPAGSGKFIPEAAVQIAAGMAASAAASASRQGGKVSLWASVGDDPAAAELLSQMEGEGVDCSAVRRVAGGRSAFASILVDAVGERMIVPYYDPMTQEEPAFLPFDDFSDFDAVLVDVRWPGAAALALEQASRDNIAGILDADVAPRSVLDRLFPLASHVVASQPAATAICGRELEAAEAVGQLARRTNAFVAVTDGANGTFWYDSAKASVRHVPAPKVTAVDTLAAGDVFHGCFALAVAEGCEIERGLRFASVAAAIKCQRFGGRLGAPSRRETLAFMESCDEL
ncbi:PfkB family carbohydrate kinase [Chelativorans sp.]|uniref:PfkB family carbohydrate kinase n=1 Tax=Chelativorans sp. TaxID=2203393 RepID=UPI0028113265|nr:PfkB family carbohydrate kinase [Chelativorans sp.]